ncbi:MAG TPA: holo-ACP synthase [Syntrophales bacterium]|nr:holo-ACP synthase [Syntrophales bacterium]
MIDAVGVDIADVKRIKSALERWGERFVVRTFSSREAEYCRRHRDSALRFAARFAAKEAFIKCMGSARGIQWNEIELLNDRSGRPHFHLPDSIQKKLAKRKIRKVHVSVTHTAEYAAAFVVFEL